MSGHLFEESAYIGTNLCVDKVLHYLQVDTRGRSGERVITEMGTRLEKVLREAKEPYHWVLILGGKGQANLGPM